MKFSIDGVTLVRMAEMIEAGANLEDLCREFPAFDGNQIRDLIEGWDD